MNTITFLPAIFAKVSWHRGYCGESGCTDPQCCCSLCGVPIGLPDDDAHFPCDDPCCEICVDQVPFLLWRGGKQAQFHDRCFRQLIGERPYVEPSATPQ